jgi:hypothetical protein
MILGKGRGMKLWIVVTAIVMRMTIVNAGIAVIPASELAFSDANAIPNTPFLNSLAKNDGAMVWLKKAESSLNRGIVTDLPDDLFPAVEESLRAGVPAFNSTRALIDRLESLDGVREVLATQAVTVPEKFKIVDYGWWDGMYRQLWIGALYLIQTERYREAASLLELGYRITRCHVYLTCDREYFYQNCLAQRVFFAVHAKAFQQVSEHLDASRISFPQLPVGGAYLQTISRFQLYAERASALADEKDARVRLIDSSIATLGKVFHSEVDDDASILKTFEGSIAEIRNNGGATLWLPNVPELLDLRRSYGLVVETQDLLNSLDRVHAFSNVKTKSESFVARREMQAAGFRCTVAKVENRVFLETTIDEIATENVQRSEVPSIPSVLRWRVCLSHIVE